MIDSEPDRNQDVSSVEKEIFSFKAHNMQYFDPEGMKEATGLAQPKDWYPFVIKELLDNAVDWLQENYKGSEDATVTATFTISADGKTLNYKVRNTNPENKPVPAFEVQNLSKIFDYSMSYGSKRGEIKQSRGKIGDAEKRIIGLPFILMNMGADGSAFFKKQWDIPLFFRANGIERQILVDVNIGASTATNQITESPHKLEHTDTEVEVTLPIIEEIKNYVTLQKIEEFCKRYAIFTTDISFVIWIFDHRPDAPIKQQKIVTKSQHPIIKNWHNATSAWWYSPEEFVNRFESVYDRKNTSVYDIIRRFEQGAQIPKQEFDTLIGVEDLSKLSIYDFMNDPDYQRKTELLYHKLREEE